MPPTDCENAADSFGVADQNPVEVLIAQGENRPWPVAVDGVEVFVPDPVNAETGRAQHDHAGKSRARSAHPAQAMPQVWHVITMQDVLGGDSKITVK